MHIPVDFAGEPEAVRLVVEGKRLAYGHLFNPTFATEISRIDPLPHQYIAVYNHLLKQSRLRFLLADDAGAGKTIMTGLYIREILMRRLISRILIVPPAGLVGNWEHELRTLFNLSFRIVDGSDARAGNPFSGPDSDLLIVSVDTLCGDTMFARLQAPDVLPYDLVVFDEAHKLAADRIQMQLRRTERYRLAEALAGIPDENPRWSLSWHAHHLLLLTATPHMGKPYPYYCLWRLLEPDALSTIEAFHKYPADARSHHFIRRTKEELIDFDERPLYPPRVSDTHSYELSKGEISEQALYDATTSYIQTYYNRANLLNRSAAQLAMSVFQRRLASSTYALLCSFERRYQKLAKLVEDMRSGRIDPAKLSEIQSRLDKEKKDVFVDETADEEESGDGQEENERSEDNALEAVLATTLADLETELQKVVSLLNLTRQVNQAGNESKFEKLCEVLFDNKYQDEKIIIFTEHRDTLDFLTRRLSGLGFTDRIAQIHGGMNYQKREEQVAFFRTPVSEGGALYLVATDAAGEGINLQVCWLMVNYDIPWNPARLEQRMGRIHRYGQKHDSVYIINLIAGKTREGKVMKTLLDKLESIRREMESDKVFDVIGRLYEDISLRDYMRQVVMGDAVAVEKRIEGTLTKEQVRALQEQERKRYGDGGAVKRELPNLKKSLEKEMYRRLLPGYVRRFIEKAAPLVDLGIEGDLATFFALRPLKPGSMDWLTPMLEVYPPSVRAACTVYPPVEREQALFLHPGEPVFDRLRVAVCERFREDALRGGVFIDPSAPKPYFFHLALLLIYRRADPVLRALSRSETLEYCLVGLRQEADGSIEQCPAESLLLLRGCPDLPASAISVATTGDDAIERAREFALQVVAEQVVERHRQRVEADIPARLSFIEQSFGFQEADLARQRKHLSERAQQENSHAKGELTKVRQRQRELGERKAEVMQTIQREPDLIAAGEVAFLAHALVVPSSDPEDRQRYNDDVEEKAMQIARVFEETHYHARVYDVSKPAGARAADLEDYPGFDLFSHRANGEKVAIEVKGRAASGAVELSENEWIKACNHRQRYWLYVAYDVARAAPILKRVQDPFGRLIVRTKQRIVIDEHAIFAAAEEE
jgi:superfamily II DNA or RNA helicase